VKNVSRNHTALTGIGAYAWGDYNEISLPQKSLLGLFWAVFTGIFVSPHNERKMSSDEFPEHLIVLRRGKVPDGLTKWVAHSIFPFYHKLSITIPERLHGRYQKYVKYLRPFEYLLVLFWLVLLSLCHIPLLLWRIVFPLKVPTKTDEEKSENMTSDVPTSGSLASLTTSSPNATNNTNTISYSTVSSNAERYITDSLIEYSGAWIVRSITNITTTIISCLLPIVAITALAKAHSINLILGLTALFTALFATALVLYSPSSTKNEVFVATAT
jgi:hypothetical protein